MEKWTQVFNAQTPTCFMLPPITHIWLQLLSKTGKKSRFQQTIVSQHLLDGVTFMEQVLFLGEPGD